MIKFGSRKSLASRGYQNLLSGFRGPPLGSEPLLVGVVGVIRGAGGSTDSLQKRAFVAKGDSRPASTPLPFHSKRGRWIDCIGERSGKRPVALRPDMGSTIVRWGAGVYMGSSPIYRKRSPCKTTGRWETSCGVPCKAHASTPLFASADVRHNSRDVSCHDRKPSGSAIRYEQDWGAGVCGETYGHLDEGGHNAGASTPSFPTRRSA